MPETARISAERPADRPSLDVGLVDNHLTERNFRIVDELKRVGAEPDATPAEVALAGVQGKPGVASTISACGPWTNSTPTCDPST